MWTAILLFIDFLLHITVLMKTSIYSARLTAHFNIWTNSNILKIMPTFSETEHYIKKKKKRMAKWKWKNLKTQNLKKKSLLDAQRPSDFIISHEVAS